MIIARASLCDVIVPPPLLDKVEGTFFSQLVRYLETVSDFGDSDLEVELAGKLPAVATGETIDFFLTDETKGYFHVLYRGRGAASYRRAAIDVRRIEGDESRLEQNDQSKEAPTESFSIKKGQAITISFTSGAIRLDVEGEAMESSFGKDLIRVKVVQTGKEFVGTVAGPLEVRVGL